MALYHMRVQVISRSAGRSVVAAAAYRSGEALRDAATGKLHDYRRKTHVEHREIMTPADAPAWMRERAALWSAVEAAERRKDAQLAREIHIALPRELDAAQRLALVHAFIRAEFLTRGMIADLTIHNPPAGDGKEQPHAHVMLTMRVLTGDGFGPKAREWNAAGLYEAWRERWAAMANRALERAGQPGRIDHRSFADRGIDRDPEPKLGPKAARLERECRLRSANENLPYAPVTERGQALQQIRKRNRLRERLEMFRAQLLRVIREIIARVMAEGRTHLAALAERQHDDTSRPSSNPVPAAPGGQATVDELLGRSQPGRAEPVPDPPDRDAILGRKQDGVRVRANGSSSSRDRKIGTDDRERQ